MSAGALAAMLFLSACLSPPACRIEARGKSRKSPGVRDVIIERNLAAGRRDFVSVDAGSATVLDRLNEGR
jgi:hypothetical protein